MSSSVSLPVRQASLSNHHVGQLLRLPCVIVLFLVLFTGGVYSPIIRNDYVAYDDELLIIDNVKARGLSWENVRQAFTTYDPELYIPLTLITEQIEYSIVGEWNPAVSHGISLVLHVLNAVLVLWLMMLLLRNDRAALMVALLWAIHPLNVEAVAWASARKDVLSGFFFLLSLCLYLQWRERFTLSLVVFLLGLLSKVSILTLPIIILLLDKFHMPNAKCQTKANCPFLRLLPFFLLSLIFGIIAVIGKESQMRAVGATLLAPFLTIQFLLRKIFVPLRLSVLYPFTEDLTLGNPSVLFGMATVAAITTGAWLARRWSRIPLFVWLTFLILLAPSFLSTVKSSDRGLIDLVVASDRFAYLASIAPLALVSYWLLRNVFGISACHGEIVEPWHARDTLAVSNILGWLPYIVVTGIIAAMSFLSLRQIRVWSSSEALFRNVLTQHQASHIAANNLAGFLAKKGETTEAMALYRLSLAIRENPRALFNLGRLMTREKRYGDAQPLFERYVALQPRDAFGRMHLGGLLLMENRVADARKHLEEAVARDPNLTEAHYLLGVARERLGDRAGARKEFQETLRLDPVHRYAKEKLGGNSLQ